HTVGDKHLSHREFGSRHKLAVQRMRYSTVKGSYIEYIHFCWLEVFLGLKEVPDDCADDMSHCLQEPLLPYVDFTLEVCKRRVLAMSLPSIPDHFTEAERTIHLSALLSFDATCMIRALGGLLKYLDTRRIGVELEHADVNVPILTVKTFSLSDLVSVDMDTYSSLQIFQKESHPSAYKSGGSGAKEGLSLFGVLNRTRSAIGSKLMRLWFLRPSRNISLLRERQEAVAFFLNPRNAEVTASLQDCLRNIKNVPRIFKQMQQAQVSITDWQSLYKTAYNAIVIADVCRAQRGHVPIFRKITEAFTEDLHHVALAISQLVDFEESFSQNRFVVKPKVDEELDRRKRTYSTLPNLMTQVAREELKKLSEEIEECSVIYVPQLGYLLAIPCTPRMLEANDFNIPGLQFMFMSNNVVHYKSASTRVLDAKLGDTHCDITDHETQIMHRLQNDILPRSQVFFAVMDYAAELDCLIALAIAAKEGNYVRPELTTSGVLDIRGGRHPLQELCVTPFVPNDAQFGGDHTRVKIITGPNASGKSVYLKQVGLIAFMALIGSFVPAESACIGLLDGIYTRVHTQESVSVGLSTFMIDLNQLSTAVRNATESSLVIVDEFGKGTNTVDGLSLLVAAVRHWLALGPKCPHLLVSTHFHAVVREGLLLASKLLSYQTMDVLENEGELVFLYQLTNGHANYSHAGHIALTAGLPEELVNRGKQVSKLLQENKPILRVDSSSSESQFRRCQEIVTKFLDLDLDSDDLEGFLREQVLEPLSSPAPEKS
ncbi:mutS protein homolog 5-like, partial [Diadema antillarum]|uniref:mutS protein homolog 5-like n=1 Tax=Diadema antillarum TaxID=105358 RepID=UPI003A848D72